MKGFKPGLVLRLPNQAWPEFQTLSSTRVCSGVCAPEGGQTSLLGEPCISAPKVWFEPLAHKGPAYSCGDSSDSQTSVPNQPIVHWWTEFALVCSFLHSIGPAQILDVLGAPLTVVGLPSHSVAESYPRAVRNPNSRFSMTTLDNCALLQTPRENHHHSIPCNYLNFQKVRNGIPSPKLDRYSVGSATLESA